jgi:hypothetical protein
MFVGQSWSAELWSGSCVCVVGILLVGCTPVCVGVWVYVCGCGCGCMCFGHLSLPSWPCLVAVQCVIVPRMQSSSCWCPCTTGHGALSAAVPARVASPTSCATEVSARGFRLYALCPLFCAPRSPVPLARCPCAYVSVWRGWDRRPCTCGVFRASGRSIRDMVAALSKGKGWASWNNLGCGRRLGEGGSFAFDSLFVLCASQVWRALLVACLSPWPSPPWS